MKATTPPALRKKKVLLVDDHPLLREGLTRLINRQPDLLVCGEAGTTPEALAAASKHLPDLALIDISLPGSDGFVLTKALQARPHKVPVLMFSMHDELVYAERALQAGARGYIMKQESTDDCLRAIRQVLAGKIAVSHAMTNQLTHRLGTADPIRSPMNQLSDRELEIFRLSGAGQTCRESATALHLSIKTIEAHRGNICRKLGLRGTPDLLRQAAFFVQDERQLPTG